MTSSKKKRILLIQCGPRAEDAALDRLGLDPDRGWVRHDAPMLPIACATIAGSTPDGYDVEIWDEHIRGQIGPATMLSYDYDVVGVSVMFTHLDEHAKVLGRRFKLLGLRVVAGGPAVSSAPESFRDAFDAIFINEAERTWPQFLRDLEHGQIQREYRQIDKPSLSESPRPDFRSIAADVPRYQLGAVQTTRGCPFDCEFCDVIYLYGRRQRHKPVDRVLDEVRALEKLGSRGIFVTDDEFVGDPGYTKELLSALIPLNGSFRHPLWFYTQLTLNLSRDDELIELIRDANFYSFLMGIESLNKDSLREAQKHQNVVRDILRDLRHIQSHGIGIAGSFVVGFDHDGPDTFDRLHDGIQQACLAVVGLNLIDAMQNTKLWVRLRAEGRAATIRLRRKGDVPAVMLNVTPGGMSRVELLEGYRDLGKKIYSWESILTRLRGWVSGVTRPPRVREAAFTEARRDHLLAMARSSWGMSAVELSDLGDTLDHAKRTAPYLLPRLAYLIAENYHVRRYHSNRLTGYDRMLELERSGDLEQDTRRVVLPTSFGAAVAPVFPELFTRLARRLPDEDLIPEALKDVLVDFVLRWGSTFQKLEPEHRVFLSDLCDRAAEKRGGGPAGEPRDGEGALLRDARKRRLFDSVLKDVRDELAKVAA
jgi:radical SAM superfamily enzyme YgiQ (UPF0313 family)